MATTKKSTKAKIKTSSVQTSKSTKVKKPIVTTTKFSNTAKQSVSTPTLKAAPFKKSPVVTSTSGFGLRQLLLISTVLPLGLAVTAELLMSDKAYPLVTGLLAKNELASQATTVFAPAVHTIYDIQLRWVVVAILGLATLTSLLLMTRLRRRYEASLINRVHLLRWIDIAVVGGLMISVIALVSGIQDIGMLMLIAGLTVLSGMMSWVAEKEHAENQRPAKAAYILSVVASLLPWLVIGIYAAATPVYGMVRNTGFVYALYATTLAGFVAGAVNLRYQLTRSRAVVNYEKTERNYLMINLLTRTAFAVSLILGLLKK